MQKNDDDSKIEARIAELVITHKAETELLKKSFEDQILSLIDKTKENKIHIESTVMDFNAKLATKSETRVLTATVIASEYVEHQTITCFEILVFGANNPQIAKDGLFFTRLVGSG